MKIRNVVFVALMVICVTAFAVEPPLLYVNPIAVALPTGTSQFFVASFSDGSSIHSCQWDAAGVGQNGVTLNSTNKEWAVFSTGTLRGVTYYVGASCANINGITRTATAAVAVK